MRREDHLVGIRHALDHVAEHRAIGFGRRVADRVGQVDRRAPAPIAASIARHEEVGIGPRRVLGRPFDVGAKVAREASPTCAIASSTCSGFMPSLTFMCSGEVAMKVWMRGALGVPSRASQARSMSPRRRARGSRRSRASHCLATA